MTLHPVRILNCDGEGSLSSIIAGINGVAAHHRSPAVANLCAGLEVSEAVDQAVRNACSV
ncbi:MULTISPECIES: hypothetical protein [Myxococcus]|uniref:Uncharacterized protein n=1 Tax=Myxococcus xanthus TaxID=34 RepID=A0AAE6KUA9_MYXXA|nr:MULTISPECIES: hypothetical protein [Myxococcus]QDE70207.1 hypothetical protein BHS09_26340 [Myxococcus xanthus]QDE77486.1 hypothetical protein BHS08_26360 [Myxococcus xanthus]QDE84880.1 hypothetical protein BHS07_26910 [Myxococcus xanthus]QDE99032.1 hypothetical protein BHS05_26150 [Myxococcus xanthus]QDF06707.1 hypothetical protein BHS04_26460 [Myxococcus xanthus]